MHRVRCLFVKVHRYSNTFSRFGRRQSLRMLFFLCTLKTAALGGFILFFGFLAFNGGSLGSISNPGDADTVALVITNTVIGGGLQLPSFKLLQMSQLFDIFNFSSSFKTLNLFYYCHHYYAGAAGALTAMLIKRLGYAEKYWSLLFTINGGLTGMVRL